MFCFNCRFKLLGNAAKRMKVDGLNSLKYQRLQFDRRKLYTYILVNINETQVMNTE